MKKCKFSPVIVYKLKPYEFANKSSSTTATGIADAYAFCFSPKLEKMDLPQNQSILITIMVRSSKGSVPSA